MDGGGRKRASGRAGQEAQPDRCPRSGPTPTAAGLGNQGSWVFGVFEFSRSAIPARQPITRVEEDPQPSSNRPHSQGVALRTRTEIRWKHLQRAGWMLWAAAFALLLALAAVVPALYARVVGLEGTNGIPAGIDNPFLFTVALAGLVVLFCLYTIVQQVELHRAVQALGREEDDRADASVRLSELSALFQVSTTLQLQLRSDVILEIIVRRVVSTLKAQQASIMILEPENGELVTRASYGLESEFSRGARKRIGEGIAGWVALRREAVSLGEKAPTAELGRHYKENRRITSALSLPLAIGERVVGVLNVNRINHTEPFGEHHLEVLRVFAEHIAAVIDRAEMVARPGRRTGSLWSEKRPPPRPQRLQER